MGFFDSFFGGLFDFDGNGTTDLGEELLGFAILEEIDAENEDEDFDLEDDF